MKIGIIGLGVVGSAVFNDFKDKNIPVIGYDKYKNGGIGKKIEILNCEIVFLCLPTLFDDINMEYDKSVIIKVCTIYL